MAKFRKAHAKLQARRAHWEKAKVEWERKYTIPYEPANKKPGSYSK